MMKDVFVIIPAYNEETVIGPVIRNVKKEGFKIIVVDDCSTDKTKDVAKKEGAIICVHKRNAGAGAATKTGILKALSLDAKYIVTIDADGQHDPADIKKLLKFKNDFDVIIGSRMINSKGMPLKRKIYNYIGSILTYFIFGIYVKDSQTGFKVFSRKAAEKIQITEKRFEFCSEILFEIKRRNLTYKEVPIKVLYSKYSLSKKHGQSLLTGIRMIRRMILLRLKKSKKCL